MTETDMRGSRDPMRLRFWTAARDWCASKVHDAFMDAYFHARQCPNCLVWTSQCKGGALSAREMETHEYLQGMTCAQCGYESIWDMRSMLPFLVSEAVAKSRLAQSQPSTKEE